MHCVANAYPPTPKPTCTNLQSLRRKHTIKDAQVSKRNVVEQPLTSQRKQSEPYNQLCKEQCHKHRGEHVYGHLSEWHTYMFKYLNAHRHYPLFTHFQITYLPCHQDSLILFQLSHERWIGFGDGPPLFNILKGLLQVPSVLLHSICDHSGGRTTDAHLAMHQTLRPCFPVGIRLVMFKKNMDVVLLVHVGKEKLKHRLTINLN